MSCDLNQECFVHGSLADCGGANHLVTIPISSLFTPGLPSPVTSACVVSPNQGMSYKMLLGPAPALPLAATKYVLAQYYDSTCNVRHRRGHGVLCLCVCVHACVRVRTCLCACMPVCQCAFVCLCVRLCARACESVACGVWRVHACVRLPH